MKFLFVRDPLERIEVAGDTTYAFMLESVARGHELWTCEVGELGLEHDRAVADARPTEVRLAATPSGAFTTGLRERRPLGDFDAVFMRKDPPVDQTYVQATWILEAARGQTVFVNDPRGLRELNEHLSVLRFPDLTPPTVVTRSHARLRQFLDEQGGKIVVKPIDGYGGRGIFLVSKGDPNVSSMLEVATNHGTAWTMAQRYIPEVSAGDKRIMLVEGEYLGAVLRVPGENEARGNLHVGGTPKKTDLTARERAIIGQLKPVLDEFGVLFAGIDVIGDQLTEINVTSPTGIRHLDALEGGHSGARVIARVEEIVQRSR